MSSLAFARAGVGKLEFAAATGKQKQGLNKCVSALGVLID